MGYSANGLVNPVNQLVTPAGKLVQLPGVRPNALALSPDGKTLVVSGMSHKLLVLDPVTGEIRQPVTFPGSREDLDAQTGSALILDESLKDKLSFTGITFSPDGSRIYLSNVNGDIKVFSVTNGTVSPLFSIGLPEVNMPKHAGIPLPKD